MQRYPFRTRFKKEIVAEFFAPVRPVKKQRIVILCDGMPSPPGRISFMKFLANKGFWAFNFRYRGSWESDGVFLEKSPHLDVLNVVSGLKGTIREVIFGQTFKMKPDEIFVIGGSFGGPAAILSSIDPRIKKAIAVCPVVDWPAIRSSEKAETSNKNYAAFVREAFGNGYRMPEKNYHKLYTGKFYNPVNHAGELDQSKIMMFHAQDDPIVPWRTVAKFAKQTGIRLKLLKRGGHLHTPQTIEKYWPQIKRFLEGK